MRRQRRRRTKHWPSQSLIYINPFAFREYGEQEDLGEGSCYLFEEIDSIIEEKVELKRFCDPEPIEMLQNRTFTLILIPELLGRNTSFYAYLNR